MLPLLNTPITTVAVQDVKSPLCINALGFLVHDPRIARDRYRNGRWISPNNAARSGDRVAGRFWEVPSATVVVAEGVAEILIVLGAIGTGLDFVRFGIRIVCACIVYEMAVGPRYMEAAKVLVVGETVWIWVALQTDQISAYQIEASFLGIVCIQHIGSSSSP